jgi:hypothetical protein
MLIKWRIYRNLSESKQIYLIVFKSISITKSIVLFIINIKWWALNFLFFKLIISSIREFLFILIKVRSNRFNKIENVVTISFLKKAIMKKKLIFEKKNRFFASHNLVKTRHKIWQIVNLHTNMKTKNLSCVNAMHSLSFRDFLVAII